MGPNPMTGVRVRKGELDKDPPGCGGRSQVKTGQPGHCFLHPRKAKGTQSWEEHWRLCPLGLLP